MTESLKVEPVISIKKWNLPFYGMPRFGGSLILSLRDFVTLFLYTEVFELSGVYTGIGIFLSYVSIALSQTFMTSLSDRTNTRWGRRRPFILFGTPILVFSFFMLFTPLLFMGKYPGDLSLFLWLIIFKCSFEWFYGFVTSPYQAMLPEITSVTERPRASQWQNIFAMLGTGVGTVITLVGLTGLTDPIKTNREMSLPFIAIFLVCAIGTWLLFFLLTTFMPKENPKFISKDSVMRNLKVAWKNKNFVHITLFQGIASLSWAMVMAIVFGYIKEVLHFSGILYYIAAVALLFGIMIFLGLWRRFIETRGKKWTLQTILIFAIICFPLALVGIFQGMDFSVIGIIVIIVIASAVGGWYLFPYILYADLTEDDVRRTKNFKAGVYTGFPSIFLNLFQGISYIVTGVLQEYLPKLAGTTVSWFYVIWAPLSSLYLLIALFYLRKKVVLDFDWEKEVKEQRQKEKVASRAKITDP